MYSNTSALRDDGSALLVEAALQQNDAGADYPSLTLELLDKDGVVLAKRLFHSNEYLLSPDVRVERVGQLLHLALEIKDPGSRAQSFRLSPGER